VRLGIARALIKMDADLRIKLKKKVFLQETPERQREKNTASRAQGNVSSSRRDNFCLERKLWIYRTYGLVLKTGLFFC